MDIVSQSLVFRTRAVVFVPGMVVQTKNINPFKKSTGKQFNDYFIIGYQAKMVFVFF